MNKVSYRLFLFTLKAIPYVIALFYIIFTIGCYFGVELNIIGYIVSCSILTWLFLYISSFIFKFCIYHRLPLYYIMLNDIINTIDTYIHLPISTYSFFLLYICLTGIFVLLYVYLKVKNYARICKRQSCKNIKRNC